MKAIILARISTKEQRDGYSLDAQISNLEAYARNKGLDVVKTFTLVESSTRGDRPEFNHMISFVRAYKKRVALIVDTVDRLQRSFRETPILNDLMQADLLELHFIKEGTILSRSSNSSQKLMWNMNVAMAQSYTDQLSDNVKRSIRYKVRIGEWPSAAPLGYINTICPITGNKTILPDPARSHLIQRMFIEYATGAYSLAEIKRLSQKWGLRTKKEKPLSVQTLHKLIQNPFYYGVMIYDANKYDHIYEPLITKSIFDACQDVLKNRGYGAKEAKNTFLYSGMFKCGVTGRKVSCDLKKGKYVYLICTDPENPHKKKWVREEVVTKKVESVLRSIRVPEGMYPQIIDYLDNGFNAQNDREGQSVNDLKAELDKLDEKIGKLTDMVLDGKIPEYAYNQKFQDIKNRQEKIENMLTEHRDGNKQFKKSLKALLTVVCKAPDMLKSSKITQNRQLLRYLFSNSEMIGAKPQLALAKPLVYFADFRENINWHPVIDNIRTNHYQDTIDMFHRLPPSIARMTLPD